MSEAVSDFELLAEVRKCADEWEIALIEHARDHGETWAQLGARVGRSANALQQRYRRLGGTRTWPTRIPKKGN